MDHAERNRNAAQLDALIADVRRAAARAGLHVDTDRYRSFVRGQWQVAASVHPYLNGQRDQFLKRLGVH